MRKTRVKVDPATAVGMWMISMLKPGRSSTSWISLAFVLPMMTSSRSGASGSESFRATWMWYAVL